MILAVVGSQDIKSEHTVVRFLTNLFIEKEPDTFVSGGARGIDTIAENLFRSLYPYTPRKIYRAKVYRWDHPEGFKTRNKKIAEICDELVCIRSYNSATYGSGWTADYAERLGKTVYRFLIDYNDNIRPIKQYPQSNNKRRQKHDR